MVWTVDREFEQPIRHMNLNAAGGSYVANLTLRFSPDLDESGVTFMNEVDDQMADCYIPSVEKGVHEFVDQRAADGRPVGYLRVTLSAITIHRVDAKEFRFTQAAQMAMTEAFKSAEIEL